VRPRRVICSCRTATKSSRRCVGRGLGKAASTSREGRSLERGTEHRAPSPLEGETAVACHRRQFWEGRFFFVWSCNGFLRRALRRWIVGGKKKKQHNSAEMASGFLIFDDLNNGQLPANLRTLLLDSRATRICNWI
jgi:hypothetical protein